MPTVSLRQVAFSLLVEQFKRRSYHRPRGMIDAGENPKLPLERYVKRRRFVGRRGKTRKPLANRVVPCAIEAASRSLSVRSRSPSNTTSSRENALLSTIRSIGPSASPYGNFSVQEGKA